MNNQQPKGEWIVYQTDDGRIRLHVRLQVETVWLTQPLMAKLFQTTQQMGDGAVERISGQGVHAEQ